MSEDELVDNVISNLAAKGIEMDRAAARGAVRRTLALRDLGVAALNFSLERPDHQLALFEIFTPHMAAGAEPFSEVFERLSPKQEHQVQEILGDQTLEEFLS